MTVAETFPPLTLIDCTPWCREQGGHVHAGLPADQRCEERVATPTDAVDVFVSARPSRAPEVVVVRDDVDAMRLPAREARALAVALTRAADVLEGKARA